ncbi:MAG: CocE/NonD family hydrolase [Bacteroidetes bacterium]|nr:CocE/NonD family hydrolase [Bacteroidota bacterium]
MMYEHYYRRSLTVLIATVLLWTASACATQDEIADRFAEIDVMIEMRDGVRLHTKIFSPRDQREPLPIIMKRTPYGIERAHRSFGSSMKELAEEGYIFAFQDIRGRFGSEGTFVMQRPARAYGDTESLDEGTDTYDTIGWMLANVPMNNGRVGMMGVSYDGWTTIMGALDPHPALSAISPQASPADMWLGDDFHHNGAFRLSYGFEYAAMMETSKETEQFSFDRYDTYDWSLELGALSNVNDKYLHGEIPTWNDYVAHPDYDDFWKRQTLIPHITAVKVPTLNVAGMDVPGVPAVIVGHTPDLAWGLTSGVADIEDVFFSRLAEDDTYLYGEEERALIHSERTILVKGSDPVTVDVVRTHHGPVILTSRAGNAVFSVQSSFWNRELGGIAALFDLYGARGSGDVERFIAHIRN